MAVLNTIDSLAGTETSLPRVARGVYNRELLSRARPMLNYQKFGQVKSLGLRQGQQMVFRRWNGLSQVTTPLTEGITPPGVSPTKTDVIATLQWYGSYIPITDKIELTHVDPIITEFSAICGENMGESIDTIHANALSGGTNFVRVQDDDDSTADLAPHDEAGPPARDTVGGTLCRTALDYAIRILDGANAKTFVPMVGPGGGQQSGPIAKAYYCLIHTNQIHDLYNPKSGFMIFNTTTGTLSRDPAFTPVHQYASQSGVIEGEAGAYRNVRFIASTNNKVWADAGAALSGAGAGLKSTSGTSCDVYSVLVIARDAYGIVPLAGNSAKIIVKDRSSGGTSDPLEQRATIGWKAITCPAVILNESWMVRIECGTTA
ncbi:MAG: N4-gp56 family major capsid protein [Xanthomonadales bacterium]|nr:N4-gp56 family major capsid protein [Xanthomonadales bacterium]